MKKIATVLAIFLFGLTVAFAQNLSDQQKVQMEQEDMALAMQNQPTSLPADYYDVDRAVNYVYVGDGASYITTRGSYYTFYENMHWQNLYTADDLGNAEMDITEIAWYCDQVASAPNNYFIDLSIRILEVDETSFTSGAYRDMTGATEVFSSANHTGPLATGWYTVDVNDFTYSGTKSLIIDVLWGDNGYWASPYARTLKTTRAGTSALYGYADSETPPNYDASSSYNENLRLTTNFTPTEPIFSITPEDYTFPEVGVLDGVPFYTVDNAAFTVVNEGIGTINITADPYLFSADVTQFAIENADATPAAIDGEFVNTGDSYDFEVAFVPTEAGLFSTLLVVTDDLGRVTRTYPINGTAYDIPDYDIVENAYEIVQDWDANPDFQTNMDFADFYDDYRLDPAASADVVYMFTVTKDSYVDFNATSGLDYMGVFANGVAIEDGNNLYTGPQSPIDAGTYYVVVSGSGAYDFTLHIEGQEPVLVVDPLSLDLGDVPIGCWHEGGVFEIYNDGGQFINIQSIALSDENDVFIMEHHMNDADFPYELYSGDVIEVSIFLDADVVGVFEGALLVTDDETTHIYPITAESYFAPIGDAFCDPEIVTFDINGHYENMNTVGDPMHDNYHLEDGYGDVVYRFTAAQDIIASFSLDNANMDAHLAIIAEDDLLNGSPETVVPVAEGGMSILDLELWDGTYYVVVAGDPLNGVSDDYTLSIDVIDMPVPGGIVLQTPVDGDNNVELDPTLTWILGDYTESIDVYCDTQYPPTNLVLNDGEPVEEFQVENLDPAQIYFWKVVAQNDAGMTESETWAFTTMVPPPLFVQGEIEDYVNVHLWWNSPFDATFSICEDFENAEMPEGWEMTSNATGSSAGWFITNAGASSYFDVPSHTYYAISNDDANNGDGSEDYLIMPETSFEDYNSASLTFASFYNGDYSQSAYVEISTDGGSTWEVASTLEANDGWVELEIDLSSYLGNDAVTVAFHADDNGSWASGWAVDDVCLNLEAGLEFRSLTGYNVYQKYNAGAETMINTDLVEETEYYVYDLAAGSYEFGVSAVFNEGESEIAWIDAIEILGMTDITGTVTDFYGVAIEGASITIEGYWDGEMIEDITTTTSTDVNGEYTFTDVPVVAAGDGWDMTCSASGFVAVEENDVALTDGVTEVVDFVLGEFPIPVTDVVAVSNDDESVATITWGEPSGFPSYEIVYDDGIATNATAWSAGYEGNMNALKFTPSGYPCTINSMMVHIYDGSWPAGDIYNEMEIVILDDDGAGGLPGTELGSIAVTPTAPNWVEVELGILGVTIGDGDFYLANRQVSTYPDCPVTAIAEGTPQSRSYSYTGGAWGTASYDCFMFRATVSGPQGTEMLGYDDDVLVNVKNRANEGATAINVADKAPGTYVQGVGTTKIVAEAPANTRAVESYEIYRFSPEDGTFYPPVVDDGLIGSTTATEYEDTDFGDLDDGVYQYAVKAIYPITESELAYSNELEKGMWSNVIVQVSLNTGEVAEGVSVSLENQVETDYMYADVTTSTEMVQFNPFRKGDYLLTVALDGYDPHFELVTVNEGAAIIEVELKEALASPINLTADKDCQDVELNWEAGNVGGVEETYDFDGDFPPSGWTLETNSSVGWFQTADGSSSYWDVPSHSSLYACSNDDATNDDGSMDYLISPQFSFAGYTSGTLTFESFYDGSYSQTAHVEISNDGGATWTEIEALTASDSWETIEIDLEDYLSSEYATAWIAFHSNDNGSWASGWAVDNVSITLAVGAENETRELQGFNVYRNGTMIAENIVETTYLDVAVPGGTHEYTVAGVFITGESDPSNIATVEVENINPIQNLTAEKQSYDNVFLEWDAPSDQPMYTKRYDDGEVYTAIGTGDAFDFAVASRWMPEDLTEVDGKALTSVSFFPNEEACEYYIRVWTGSDADLVVEQMVTDVVIGAWNTVELDTPVQVDGSDEFWFGYRANATAGYPAGCDAGPAVAGLGDMIYDAESGWLSMSQDYGLDYNWNIVGKFVAASGEMSNLPVISETITASTSDVVLSKGEILDDVPALVFEDRDLAGYMIYRNFEMIADGVQENFYIDYDVSQYFVDPVNDEYVFNYLVVASYESGCVSDQSNFAVVSFGVDNENLEFGDINIYPIPAKDFVNIELTDNIETVRVTNYVGQIVYSKTITSEDIIKIDNLQAGSYIVELMTNSGETYTDRFIIVK